MDDPSSFNELFVQAKAGGYRLACFEQNQIGNFICAWAHGETTFYRTERREPFTAMLDAFVRARDIVNATNGAPSDEAPAAAPASDELF